VFDQTGGLHAAGLAEADGTTVMVREDVGRHNAVDKLVGRSLLDGALPLRDRVLVVSGRVSFEIVQKAALAGLPVLAAVSAPSSLAVTTARDLGLTVVAFIRSPRANVYTHPERVDFGR
jgi:FdhD protein